LLSVMPDKHTVVVRDYTARLHWIDVRLSV
jgi:hypothetical protein